MGLISRLRGLTRLQNTTQDAVTEPTGNNSDNDKEDFEDIEGYQRINRNIKNARWAYDNDSTVNSSINNAVITANRGFQIVADSPEYEEAAEHIRIRSKDWDLRDSIEEAMIKAHVDGTCFIQKRIKDNAIYIHFLAYDGDEYDFRIIRNPDTEEVLGYKQKAPVTRLDGSWKSLEFDDLDLDGEEEENNFLPEEIICIQFRETDGQGNSAVYPALDLVDAKRRIEKYMLKAAHKSGSILGLEIGADGYDASELTDDNVTKVVNLFSEHDGKEVVAYNAGIKPARIGSNVLLDYTLYLNYLKGEIRSTLLTPDSKFESSKGSRFTAAEQMSGSTGFVVYIEYLQEFIKNIFEPELFDDELELAGYEDAKGHVHIQFKEIREDEEQSRADIGVKLFGIYPNVDPDVLTRAYFPGYVKVKKEKGLNNALKPELEDQLQVEFVKEPERIEVDGLEDERLLNTHESDEDPTILKLKERGWKGLKGKV